ncbi:MAG: hypothetical protein CME88_07305 [Hirschia sp.]|nr:hypothetical protein [Hirschia sp.]MBF18168.1 hypothetical protein [Hirschia sp.]
MKQKILAALGLALLAGGGVAHAQQNYNGVRVLVAADDSNKNSIVRSSDVYHRLQIPLNEEMKRFGYTAIFPDAMMAELEWKSPDRADKQQTIGMVKQACQDANSRTCPRVIVLVRTMASAEDLGYGTRAKVRMTGELIDAQTNAYLGGWEAPTLKFNAPANCNQICLEDVVGENSRKVALNLSDTLRRMLDQQALGQSASTGGAVTGQSAAAGLVNTYKITFEHMELTEIIPLKSLMENEFPMTEDISAPMGSGNFFSLNLNTRAKTTKLLEWIPLMLQDRGYDLANFKIYTGANGDIIIDRIVDSGFRPVRTGSLYQ